jgi:hypothetical protein
MHIPTERQSLVITGRSPVALQDDRPGPELRKFDRAAGSLSDFAAAKNLSELPPPPAGKCSETGDDESNDQPSEDYAHHCLRVVC